MLGLTHNPRYIYIYIYLSRSRSISRSRYSSIYLTPAEWQHVRERKSSSHIYFNKDNMEVWVIVVVVGVNPFYLSHSLSLYTYIPTYSSKSLLLAEGQHRRKREIE